MVFKELEIQGFKSFPDKVKITFDEGVTGVVGPNGSGKCGCFRCGHGRSFRRGRFFLSSSLAFILCGGLLCGTSGDLFNQFALLYHDVFDAESFGDFAQFGETFPFERFQILHIFLFQSDFFENPGGRRACWNSPAKIVHYFEIQNKKLLFTSFRPTFSP